MKYLTATLVALIVVVFGMWQAAAETDGVNWLSNTVYLAYDGNANWQNGCEADYHPIVRKDNGVRTTSTYYGCVVHSSAYDYLVGTLGADPENNADVYAIRSSSGQDKPFYWIDTDTTSGAAVYYRESGTFLVMTGAGSDSPNLKLYKNPVNALEPQYDQHGILMGYTLKDTLGIDGLEYAFSHSLFSKALTPNGKYLFATYIKETHVMLIKIDTQTSLRTESFINIPYTGRTVISAVSNDGRYAFIDKMVYDNKIESRAVYDLRTCEYDGICQARDLKRVLDGSDFESYFHDYAFKARFSEDGSALTMWFRWGSSLTMSLLPIDDGRLDYLALGDSFSSGEGDLGIDKLTKKNYYREHTDDDGYGYVAGHRLKLRPTEKCHVSTRSYPYKLATGMELGASWNGSTGKWGSVACSGALAMDLNGQSIEGYRGQVDLGTGKPRLQGYDHESLKTEALNKMIPGRQKQLEFVSEYQPKAVTLTAGGNDVSFAKIIRACVSPNGLDGGEWTDICSYARDDDRKAYVAESIVNVRSKLVDLYTELLAAGRPDMKLYVLGYPVFVDDQVVKNNYIIENIAICGANVRLNYQERQMIVESTKFLNKIIQSAAREAGAIYISTTDAFGQHKLCGKYSPKAVNGITGALSNVESFHPNELGHAILANRVWDATNGESLVEYECSNSNYITCPDGSSQPVPMPDYFKKAVASSEKIRLDDSLSDDVLIKFGKAVLNVANFTLAFSRPVLTVLYSDKTVLGTTTTNEHGGLGQEVTIPGNIKPGYHTLEITSTGPDGESITLWKIVEVRSEDPNDYDGDGIPNDHDHCTYIDPLGIDTDRDGIDDGCDPEIGAVASLHDSKGILDAQISSKSSHGGVSSLESTENMRAAPRQNLDDWDAIRSGVRNRKVTPVEGVNPFVLWVIAAALLLAITVSGILLRKRNSRI